jgi:hypothetical protein
VATKEQRPAPFRFNGARSNGHYYNTGLYSKAKGVHLRDLKVESIVRRMRRVAPWLKDSDVPVCQTWARLEVLIGIGYAALTKGNAYFDKNGDTRRLLADVRSLINSQLLYSKELGLTPAALVNIRANSTNAALDLAGVAAQLNNDAANGDRDARPIEAEDTESEQTDGEEVIE